MNNSVVKLTPVLQIPVGEFLWREVRVDEFGFPVLAPCTFVETVESILAASCIKNNQWDLMGKLFTGGYE